MCGAFELHFILSNESVMSFLCHKPIYSLCVPFLGSPLNCGDTCTPLTLSFLSSVALWLPTVVIATTMRTYWKEWRMRKRS